MRGGAPPLPRSAGRSPESRTYPSSVSSRPNIPMRSGIPEQSVNPRRAISSGDLYSRRSHTNILDKPPRSGEMRFAPSMGNYTPPRRLEHNRFSGLMPMDVPLGESRRRLLNQERLKTARHEGRHVIATKVVGGKVDFVSTKPEGKSLGRTRVRASYEAFQIIAGASASGKGADGYSHDFWQIAQIDNYLGKRPGSSIKAAVSTAEHLINKHFPESVQEKLSEIIALHEEINGEGEIQKIIDQAFWEYAKEQNDPRIFSDYKDFKEEATWREVLRKAQGIHADIGSLVIEEYGESEGYAFSDTEGYSENKITCNFCPGENGNHAPNCWTLRRDEKNDVVGLTNPVLTDMRDRGLAPKVVGERRVE